MGWADSDKRGYSCNSTHVHLGGRIGFLQKSCNSHAGDCLAGITNYKEREREGGEVG